MTKHCDTPELIAAVIQAAGLDAAEAMVARWAGTRVYVTTQRLSELMSADKARRVVAAIGAGAFDVPLWSCRHVAERERRAAELAAGGKDVRAIAAELGCTERHVRRILGQPKRTRNKMHVIKGPHSGMERRFVAEPTVEDFAELHDELHRARHGFGLDARQLERVREGWDNMPAHVQANAWREVDLELLRHSRTAA